MATLAAAHAPRWGRILFLDLGRVTGWADGDPAAQYPESGAIELGRPGAPSAGQYKTLMLWVLERIRSSPDPIRMVCFESPIAHLVIRQSAATKRILLGYPAVVETAAALSNIADIREASIADIRRNLLGRGISKKEDAKTVVQQHLRALGVPFGDHNSADAVAGWYFACTAVDPKAGEKVTPMFSKGGDF